MLSFEQLLPLFLLMAMSVSATINFFILRRPNLEKNSAYECGFQAFETPLNRKVEISFFMVAVSFLIFDVETVLLIGWVIDPVWSLSITSFMLILFATLIIEVAEGVTDVFTNSGKEFSLPKLTRKV